MSALQIILAITFAIISYSMLNIGLALEKKGAAALPKIEGQSVLANLKNFITNKVWLIGFLLTNIQWIFFILAVDFGTLSLITPMLGVGLVVLVVFSYFVLKEQIVKLEFIAIAGIVIGTVILGGTNNKSEVTYTLDQMNAFFETMGAIVFFTSFTLVALALILIALIGKTRNAGALLGLAAGIAGGLGAIFTKAFMGGISIENFWPSLVAAVARWEWWIYFLLLIALNFVSTLFLQFGFQKGKAVVVSPLFSMTGLIAPVIGGIIIFAEWGNLTWWIILLKSIAMLIVAVGIAILSSFSARNQEESVLLEKSELNMNKDEKDLSEDKR